MANEMEISNDLSAMWLSKEFTVVLSEKLTTYVHAGSCLGCVVILDYY